MQKIPKLMRVLEVLLVPALFLTSCNLPFLVSSTPKVQPTNTINPSSQISPVASEAAQIAATTEAPAPTEQAGPPTAIATQEAIIVSPPTRAPSSSQQPEPTSAMVYPTYTSPTQGASQPTESKPPANNVGVVYPTYTSPTQQQSQPPQQQAVKFYLIGVGDNGKSGKLVGCGDSAIAVTSKIPPTRGVLRAALEQLLSIKDQYYGQSGLYNALYLSNLKVENVRIDGGYARIWLSGSLKSGGECDDPRIKAQLYETALQFPTIKKVTVFVNGRDLDELLSLK